MPLRDHFRPPVSKKSSWEGFHAMWPTCIVQQLRNQLPPGFVAEPRVHLGTLMEIDVGALESATRLDRGVKRKRQRRHGGRGLDRHPSSGRGRDGTARRVRVRGPHLRCRARTATGRRDRIRQPREQGSPGVAGRLRRQVRSAASQGRRRQHRRSRHDSPVQPVRSVDGVRRASGPGHDGRRTTDLRGILPLGDEGYAGAIGGLVPHHDHRPAAADAAAVVGGFACRSSRFGAELRASVPRFVDHVTAAEARRVRRSARRRPRGRRQVRLGVSPRAEGAGLRRP